MESKANYRTVGLFVILLAAGLLMAGLWLSVGFDRKIYKYYLVYMTEAVSGLNEDSLVKFNGVQVGFVKNIQLNTLNPEQVQLTLSIEQNTPVTTGTRAKLVSQGITGTTYIELSSVSTSLIPLQKTPGEPYPVIPSQLSFLNQLKRNVDDVSSGIKQAFDAENAENLKKILKNFQIMTEAMAKNDDNIRQSFQELPKVLVDLRTAITHFNGMATSLSKAGTQVSETMVSAKKGIQQISQQAVPPTILLLRRLDIIASNLEKMSAQLRQNPSVIIRGNIPQPKGPGE